MLDKVPTIAGLALVTAAVVEHLHLSGTMAAGVGVCMGRLGI